jgi:L-glutamine-phosphate cytidylyltransferase
MKVIILCAGMGSRLKSYTDGRPKCMVEFCNHPLLDWQIAALNSCGLRDITLLGGYKSELLKQFNLNIVLNERYSATNMLYSLLKARDVMLGGEDIIISYGDIIYEPRIIESLVSNKNNLVIAADLAWKNLWSKRFSDPLDDAETFILNEKGTLSEIGERPKRYDQVEGQYRGLIKISSNYVERFLAVCDIYRSEHPVEVFESLSMTEILMFLVAQGDVVDVAATNGGWLEFDNVTDLEIYTELQAKGKLEGLFNVRSIEL